MELSHVDISVPQGALTEDFVGGLERLVCGIFGWTGGARVVERPGFEPVRSASYRAESTVLTLHEADSALQPGDEDHLGFLVDLAELERLAAACGELAAGDPRFETRYLTDGVADAVDIGSRVFHTFFVRFRLPLWFQFEHYAPKG